MNRQIVGVLALLMVFGMAGVFAESCAVAPSFSGECYDPCERTVISGFVYNQDSGEFVSGADVMITCDGNLTQTVVSDEIGFYSVNYPADECSRGESLEVLTVKGEMSGAWLGVVGDNCRSEVNLVIVNVFMTPEFGFYMGALTLLASIGIFFVVRKN